MISVVREYDSRKILDSGLRKSIFKQTADYQFEKEAGLNTSI